MSISILCLWLVLATLSILTARRAHLVDWLGRRRLVWRLLARFEKRSGAGARTGR